MMASTKGRIRRPKPSPESLFSCLILSSPSGRKLFHLICDFLSPKFVVAIVFSISKQVRSLLLGYKLPLYPKYDFDISWFKDHAVAFGKNFSVDGFGMILEGLDTVSDIQRVFFNSTKRDESFLRPEDVTKLLIDDKGFEKMKLLKGKDRLPQFRGKIFWCQWDGIGAFPNVDSLIIKGIEQLFPDELINISLIEVKDEKFDMALRGLRRIKFLKLEHAKDIYSGNGFRYTTSLTEFYIRHCEQRTFGFLADCISLEKLTCEHADSLESLEGLQLLSNLKFLSLQWCKNLIDIAQLAALNDLEHLHIIHCEKLVDLLPIKDCRSLLKLALETVNVNDIRFLYNLNKLQSLQLNFCPVQNDMMIFNENYALTELKLNWFAPKIMLGFEFITYMELFECVSLTSLEVVFPQPESCRNLEVLIIRRCDSLIALDGLEYCSNLRKFFISACQNLNDIYSLNLCEKVEDVTFQRIFSSQLTSFPDNPNSNIRKMAYRFCDQIYSLEFLINFKALNDLIIDSCTSLTDLSGLSRLPTVKNLKLKALNNLLLPTKWDIISPYLESLEIGWCNFFQGLIYSKDPKNMILRQMKFIQCLEMSDLSFIKPITSMQKLILERCWRAKIDEELSSQIELIELIELGEIITC